MKSLKYRFIDDFKYPITVTEDPYFEYQLELCPGAKEDWDRLMEGINTLYGGNENKFLDDFYKTREKLVVALNESKVWKVFNESVHGKDYHGQKDHIDYYKVEESHYRKNDIYNEEFANKGRSFISIDLTKANVQAFNYIDQLVGKPIGKGVSATSIWEEWISMYCESDFLKWYMSRSKYIRQVVFGNVNPKRQIAIEKWLIFQACKDFIDDYTVLMYGSDEILLEGELTDKVVCPDWIDVKIKPFKLESITFEAGSGNLIRIYQRQFEDGTFDYKCIQRHYYAQIINLIEGREPDPEGRDLVFYNEKELARFIKRIKIKERD